MFLCPHCQSKLIKVNSEVGRFWSCPACNGRAVTLPVLQKVAPQKSINQLWQGARSGTDVGGRPCPACDRQMKVVPLADTGSALYVDVCLRCHFVWFDPHEFETVPEAERRLVAHRELSPAASAALARAEVQLLQEQRTSEYASAGPPDSWWEITLTVLGFPVEHDKHGIFERPILTWSLSALMVVAYALSFSDLRVTAENWGLVPGDPFRHYGVTFISSFLLHGGIFHLLGNLYFFLVFGDNVEDEMGRSKYLLLLAAAVLLGDAFHFLGDPRSNVPLIGASGGISGILVYYALQFPHTRIGLMLYFRWYLLPVRWLLILWLVVQVFGVFQQAFGFGNVSALAHLGGASAGFLFWLHSRLDNSQGSRGTVASQV